MTHFGITHQDLVRVVINFFTREFQAATEIPARGFFAQPTTGEIQSEAVRIIYCYADKRKLVSMIPTIEALAKDLAVSFNQASFAFEIDRKIYFAAPSHSYRTKDAWRLGPKKGNKELLRRAWYKYWQPAAENAQPFWRETK